MKPSQAGLEQEANALTGLQRQAPHEHSERQQHEPAALARQQKLQALSMRRRLWALELVEQRECESLETVFLKERRIEERERTGRKLLSPEPSPMHADVFSEAARKPID